MSDTTSDEYGLIDVDEDVSRRDFIHLLAVGAAAAGGVGVVIPLVHQMNPDAAMLALATKEVDISTIEVGQAVKVMWQGKPVFIRRRTAAEIAAAKADDTVSLKDPIARNENLKGKEPATDANRVEKPEWLVLVGVCTHLGCIPLGTADGDVRGEYDGWFCPCHGSHYDISGRIRKGPAPKNLDVPPYEFMTDTKIKIG